MSSILEQPGVGGTDPFGALQPQQRTDVIGTPGLGAAYLSNRSHKG